MNKVILILSLFLMQFVFGQQKETVNEKEIKQLMNTFMECIAKKDSIQFYSLFHEDPVVWIGVFKEKTKQVVLKNDSKAKTYFSSNYREFFRGMASAGNCEEKFYNVEITEDGSIASASFDYSFWMNNQKTNWGKENWGLIKINNQWKITSVLFSMDYENINPEPLAK